MARIIRINRESDQSGQRFDDTEGFPNSLLWEQALGRHLCEARTGCLRGLEKIPAGLGQMGYLSILQHRLLEVHENLFNDFCSCSLQQKREWLFRLLACAISDGTLPRGWRNGSVYSDLIPRSVKQATREKYLTEIEVVLEILKVELDGISRHRIVERVNNPHGGALSNLSRF